MIKFMIDRLHNERTIYICFFHTLKRKKMKQEKQQQQQHIVNCYLQDTTWLYLIEMLEIRHHVQNHNFFPSFRVHLAPWNRNGNGIRKEVNLDTMIELGFGFHENGFFILILILFLKNNPNTVMNGKWKGFPFPILYSSIQNMPLHCV